MKSTTLRIGTRGSKLALVQTKLVETAILQQFPHINIEIKIIKTSGDLILNEPLTGRIDKGFFTSEIETAMLNNQIDIAVHSFKDLPVEQPAGLSISACLPRENAHDLFISADGRKLVEMPDGSVIATCSLRRKAQLLAFNPKFKIIDIRGNVDTRLAKLANGYAEAIILAAAGLNRLSINHPHAEELPFDLMLPAPAQGVIAIETRTNDSETNRILKTINHEPSFLAATVERLFLHEMGGGCHLPVACFCELSNSTAIVCAFISSPNGDKTLSETITCKQADLNYQIKNLAQTMLQNGGIELLNQCNNHESH